MGEIYEKWRTEPFTEEIIADLKALEDEYDSSLTLIQHQADLLTGVVNAIRGEPEKGKLHSHHDVVELVTKLIAEKDELSDHLLELQERIE